MVGLALVDRFRGRTWYPGKPRIPSRVLPALPAVSESDNAFNVFRQIARQAGMRRFAAAPSRCGSCYCSRLAPDQASDLSSKVRGSSRMPACWTCSQRYRPAAGSAVLGLEGRAKDADALDRPLFDTEQVAQIDGVVANLMQVVMWDYPSGEIQIRPNANDEEVSDE